MTTAQTPPPAYRDVDAYIPPGRTVSHMGERIGRLESLVEHLMRKSSKDWDEDEHELMRNYLRWGDQLDELLLENGCVDMGGNFIVWQGELH